MLPYPAKNLSILAAFYGGATVRSPEANRLLKDGDTITIDGHTFEVIHTPGHTPGGICLYSKNQENGQPPCLIFRRHPFQRRHWADGLSRLQREKANPAIKERLFVLDEKTIVYPGHGPSTTIAEEKKYNPFVT